MRYTDGEVFKVLKEEGVHKVEKGAILNEDDGTYLITTKQGNLFSLKESFFDMFSIDEVFEICYGCEVHKDFKMYRNKKAVRKERLACRIQCRHNEVIS